MTNYPNIKDRIRQLMEATEMNQKDFAIITGITAPTLSSIFNGRTSATLNHVMALHKEFPNVRMEWLLFGEGKMYETSIPAESDANSPDAYQGTLFSTPSSNENITNLADSAPANTTTRATISEEALAIHMEQVKNINKLARNISEIRIFFDDGTFEIFTPKE